MQILQILEGFYVWFKKITYKDCSGHKTTVILTRLKQEQFASVNALSPLISKGVT